LIGTRREHRHEISYRGHGVATAKRAKSGVVVRRFGSVGCRRQPVGWNQNADYGFDDDESMAERLPDRGGEDADAEEDGYCAASCDDVGDEYLRKGRPSPP
jgi:hypothetical protein